ncbi:MAG: hypothetical protein ABII12_10900 [Planctomycetota bacterium]
MNEKSFAQELRDIETRIIGYMQGHQRPRSIIRDAKKAAAALARLAAGVSVEESDARPNAALKDPQMTFADVAPVTT